MSVTTEFRIEKDFLGERKVPIDAYYGVQTLRAIENFPITGYRIHPALIRAMAIVKKAAALANRDTGHLDAKIADAISSAADEVIAGKFHDQFLVDPIQGGAGTSINMNTNEVLANRALEILGAPKGTYKVISPNTHVNMAQSTNDAFPTGVHIATLDLLKEVLGERRNLRDAFAAKEKEYEGTIKMGRTHLQDAVPIRLGPAFGGYRRRDGAERRPRLHREGGAVPGGDQQVADQERRAPRGRNPEYGRLHRGFGDAQGLHDEPVEDRQRPPDDGVRAPVRPRRAAAAGPSAGQQHHAREGEPGDGRGGEPGRLPGHRERPHDLPGLRGGPVRAERDGAGAGLQPAPDDQHHEERLHRVPEILRRGARCERGPDEGVRGQQHGRHHRDQPARRVRDSGPDRPGGKPDREVGPGA